MCIFIEVIKSCLFLSVLQLVRCNVHFGRFGIFTDSTSRFSTTDSYMLLTSTFVDHSPRSPLAQVEGNEFSILREIVLPIFSIVSMLSTSSYFIFLFYRSLKLHCKYRQFTFRRQANTRGTRIQMSSLDDTDVYHDAISV